MINMDGQLFIGQHIVEGSSFIYDIHHWLDLLRPI